MLKIYMMLSHDTINIHFFLSMKKCGVKVSSPTAVIKGEARLRRLSPVEINNGLRGKDLESQVDAMT